MNQIVPTSAIVATCNRQRSLVRTLKSLAVQDVVPAELIVIDGSTDDASKLVVEQDATVWLPDTAHVWQRACQRGAGSQRNQGMAMATQPFIWFFDDDVVFEPDCVQRLWDAISSDRQLGGVNAMIINQRYQAPGRISRSMFTMMHGKREQSFAGRVIGPAINLLPEDRDDLPEVIPVEWLNTTCTIYRREALPLPPFDPFFTGYSLMEDLTLSLRVAQRGWKLANARTARIFHDSQSRAQKQDAVGMASMELRNRYYVMTAVMGRRRVADYFRLVLWECFAIASSLTNIRGLRNVPRLLLGKISAFRAPGGEAGK